jgi:hypothetical protein
MMRSRILVAAALAIGIGPCAVAAQTSNRLCTTPASLRASPVFYHGKQIAVLGAAVEGRDFVRLEAPGASGPAPAPVAASSLAGDRPIYLFWRGRPQQLDGEVRGEFWDLGRLTEGDSRFSAYDFRPLLEATNQGRWPARDQLFVILGATVVEAVAPSTPTLRSIALSPERYENRGVTISGRFRGRNLFADLAAPVPTPTKWDFVIQSADAAVWISGLRPKGKGFELDPSARVDTGRWVQVTGVVRRDGARSWIEGTGVELTAPPEETQVEIAVPATPREPPPAVVFSAPVPDEPDVDATIVVRIQFSRDMDARSFKDHVRVSYLPPAQVIGPPPPPPIFNFAYNVGNRGIELKFAKPLEKFQTVRVELLEGIKSIDGDALQPWTLNFTTGR